MSSMENTKKVKQSGTVSRLMKYLKPHSAALVLAFVCGALSAVGQLFVPVIIGDTVDLLVGVNAVDFAGVVKNIITLAVIIAVAMIMQWLMNLFAQRASHTAVRDARKDGFAAITDASLSVIDNKSHGDLSSRVSVDADQIADGIIQGATQLFTGVVTIVGTLVFMIRINGWIALAVAALTPLSLLVSFFVARGTHKYFAAQTITRGNLYQCGEETISNRALVAAYNYAPVAEKKFAGINAELKDCGFKATFYSSLVNPSTRLINSLVYAVAAIMGALYAIDGKMSVGDISTLLLFANQFARPLNEITGVITEFQTSLAAAKRVFDLADLPPQDDSGKNVALSGDIKINSLDFAYDVEKPLIQDLDLDVPRGTMVAIVGRTGCGKTTLINLLMRFYDPQKGGIEYDGIADTELSRSCVRGSFGMVLQDSWIFKGSVRDNIAYGKPDATLDEIKLAAKKADIDGFIERMPNGYDTIIDDGDGISQGQKQLINIARIMLVDPPMLILDEATSNIDTRTEKRVQMAFDRLLHPEDGDKKTGFVVAHRLSTIRNADVILVMDKGRIIERGTHDELIEKKGSYFELYNAQFAGQEQV